MLTFLVIPPEQGKDLDNIALTALPISHEILRPDISPHLLSPTNGEVGTLNTPLIYERKEPSLFAIYARGPARTQRRRPPLLGPFATAIPAAGRCNLVVCPACVFRELTPLGSHGWRLGTVQHESTATCLDSGGLMRTSWDGDLRRWTRVDGLPLYGMQEVWGSNPHSSTPAQRL